MGAPCPHHCPPESGKGMAALAVLALFVVAVIARPLIRAAVDVLEVVLIAAASLAGAALCTAAVVLVVRARRRRLALARGRAVSCQVTIAAPARSLPAAQPVVAELAPRGPVAALPVAQADVPTQAREHVDTHAVTGREACPHRVRRAGRWQR